MRRDTNMKKFMKGCAITALCLIVIGFTFATVAGTVRGRTTIQNVVESVTGGRIRFDLDDLFDEWGLNVFDNIDYSVGDNIGFNRYYSTLSGTIDKYSLGSDINELDIEVGACSFTTKTSTDDNFYIEVKNAGKFQGYVEDATLYIKSSVTGKRWGISNTNEIIIYIPEGAYFDNADIEVGAGMLEFDGLTADRANLEVGAGQITLSDMQVNDLKASVGMGQITLKEMSVENLDAEVGMGQLSAEGLITGDASIECSMGNVILKLEGSQQDFNYELSKAMGNVTLGKESSSGFASERYVDNNSDKTMDIECAMGNVTIRFTE